MFKWGGYGEGDGGCVGDDDQVDPQVFNGGIGWGSRLSSGEVGAGDGRWVWWGWGFARR